MRLAGRARFGTEIVGSGQQVSPAALCGPTNLCVTEALCNLQGHDEVLVWLHSLFPFCCGRGARVGEGGDELLRRHGLLLMQRLRKHRLLDDEVKLVINVCATQQNGDAANEIKSNPGR